MNPRLLSAVRIALGLLFFQHGAEKLWGFAGGQMDRNFATLHGFAGPIEVIGGTLIIFGLFTRVTSFILCGQMAVAYFDQWAGRGFFPISNGGEEAVIFCFLWLWLVTAGSGIWTSIACSAANRMSPERSAGGNRWDGQSRASSSRFSSLFMDTGTCSDSFPNPQVEPPWFRSRSISSRRSSAGGKSWADYFFYSGCSPVSPPRSPASSSLRLMFWNRSRGASGRYAMAGTRPWCILSSSFFSNLRRRRIQS